MINDYIYNCPIVQLTKVNPQLLRGRCPICGDSEKSHTKKRFNIYLNTSSVFCFNCGFSNSIENLIKYEFPDVWKDYIKSILTEKNKKKELPVFEKLEKPKNNLPNQEILSIGKRFGLVTDVSKIGYMKKYLDDRHLDYRKFWFLADFFGFINHFKKNKIDFKSKDPRIVLPYLNKKDKKIYGFQGRSLTNKSTKYLTYILDENYHKFYNYYNVNNNKRVYVTEGPFDSFHLPNSFALSGAQINQDHVKEFKEKFNDLVFIIDNDFIYNTEVNNFFNKIIEYGFQVYLPPKDLVKYKDLNDLSIKGGFSNDEIKKIINNNIYSGKMVEIELLKYRKF